MSTKWQAVIGLEIHVQLATRSKIFSGSATAYGADSNTQACALDLGMPGTLPVLNAEAVRMAALFGLAINADVAEECIFARKNYFYPDLPKGYQISQFEKPIVSGGSVVIDLPDGDRKTVNLTRAHLEEDAGKSLHGAVQGMSGIDLNRAGTPLLEIVSEPEMHSAAEAVAYMRKIHTLVRYLGISDGNMQEGSFRCDANVSLRPMGSDTLGTRAELKNINSFRFVEKAIEYEIDRQAWLLESGEKVVQETRLYDSQKGETRSMRGKEEANDYRYFPDPDLLPVYISREQLNDWQKTMPELPDAKAERYQQAFKLAEDEAHSLTTDKDIAAYFEAVMQEVDASQAKTVSNWLLVELAGALNKSDLEITGSPIGPGQMAGLVTRMADGTISGKIAKKVFQALWDGAASADEVIEKQGLKQITDSGAIEQMVDDVIQQFPDQVSQYQQGQEKLLQFLVGQVMKASRGKANPGEVNRLLKDKLD